MRVLHIRGNEGALHFFRGFRAMTQDCRMLILSAENYISSLLVFVTDVHDLTTQT